MASSPARPDENTFAQQLELARAAAGVTGASFAYWDGSALHTATAGLRNSVSGDAVTLDTVMHIGSITKILTTVLLMQLVDEGLVALDEPVIRYLPEFRLRDRNAAAQITCRMLVNHTSGIDCDILPDQGPDQERIADAIARCETLEQLHAPGEGPSYSNMGFVIAGYLVQTLRRASWYSLIKTRIYEPLGMHHSIADFADLPRFRTSVGDLTDPVTSRLVQSTRPFYAPSFAPCGTTLMMTATDLLTFARMLMNGGIAANGTRVLSANAVARMSLPTTTMLEPLDWRWGLGWMLTGEGLLTHSGGGPGVCSTLVCHPASGRVLVLLTNCDRWDALKPTVIDPIVRSWIGGESAPVVRDACADVETGAYEGIYENNIMRAEVFPRAGGLALRMTIKAPVNDQVSAAGFPPIPLTALGDDTFEGAGWVPGMRNTQFRFVAPDARGRMTRIAFLYRLLTRRA